MPLDLTPSTPPYYTIEEGNLPQNGYKIYEATLNQTGTDAPVATIHNNTIGTIVWTRTGTGTYIGTLTGAFPTALTTITITNDPTAVTRRTFGSNTTANTVTLSVWELFISAGAWDNFQTDGLQEQFITIKVFNT